MSMTLVAARDLSPTGTGEYAALVQAVAENDYLNGEVIRLDGALRFPPK
jgi:hypothetical protein